MKLQQSILVTDSTATIQDLVKNAMAQLGYEVIVASSSQEATQVLAQQEVDLVITNGEEQDDCSFVQNIRQSSSYRFTPVLMMGEDVSITKAATRQVNATGWVMLEDNVEAQLIHSVKKVLR